MYRWMTKLSNVASFSAQFTLLSSSCCSYDYKRDSNVITLCYIATNVLVIIQSTHDFLTLKWSLFSSSFFLSASPDLFLKFQNNQILSASAGQGNCPRGKTQGKFPSTLKRKSRKWPRAYFLRKLKDCFKTLTHEICKCISMLETWDRRETVFSPSERFNCRYIA